MHLWIDGTGEVRCLYAEAIDLGALGVLTIRRASHVEPGAVGRWWADLAPLAGPRLGPFARRSEALRAEADWIDVHLFERPLSGTQLTVDTHGRPGPEQG
jgi:hypothetical protein